MDINLIPTGPLIMLVELNPDIMDFVGNHTVSHNVFTIEVVRLLTALHRV